jgi:ABC-type uncharacterized transport system YnjBCD substrate-binding protein
MKRTVTILTLTAVVIAGAATLFAGVTAPKTSATTSLCHVTTLSIKAPTSVVAGKTITVTGAEAKVPQHTVKATLQYRKSTSTKWINGASANLVAGKYTLKWKAPAKKGKYKIRVRVTHLAASHTSAVKTVTVK